jgi:hypothetical protein
MFKYHKILKIQAKFIRNSSVNNNHNLPQKRLDGIPLASVLAENTRQIPPPAP